MRNFVMTSESVTAGHPDKLCDQISDGVVDAYLAAGCGSGVIAECAIATGVIFLSVRSGGEPPCDLARLARQVIVEAGYERAGHGSDAPTVMLDLVIGDGSTGGGHRMRAGQMTTAFGYACDQTQDAMPLPIWAAHRLARALDAARRDGRLPWLSPDAQAQVAVAFRARRPVALPAIAFAFGTRAGAPDAEGAAELLRAEVVAPAFDGAPIVPDSGTRVVCRPVGAIAGPEAHSGLTGRKSADDGYGGFARQSGAAFSGKDPGRIDRTAQYAARQAARSIVAAGLAQECEVQLSYILGDTAPASIEVDSFGTAADDRLSRRLAEVFDFRVEAISERLDLWRLPSAHGGRFYRDLATYGQIGRADLGAPWEDTALAAALG